MVFKIRRFSIFIFSKTLWSSSSDSISALHKDIFNNTVFYSSHLSLLTPPCQDKTEQSGYITPYIATNVHLYCAHTTTLMYSKQPQARNFTVAKKKDHRQTNGQTWRQTKKKEKRDTERQVDTETNRKRDRQRYWLQKRTTDRPMNIHTYIQTDRQIDAQTKI